MSRPKSAEEVKARVSKALTSPSSGRFVWADEGTAAWPMEVSLGTTGPAARALGAQLGPWIDSIEALCRREGVSVATKRVAVFPGVAAQELPGKVIIETEAAAGRLAPDAAREIEKRAARRYEYSSHGFPRALRDRVLRATRGYTDTEFSLLLQLGDWCREHDTAGLSPRQVAVPGVQGKFLDSARNRELTAELAGRETLGLSEKADFVMVKYLDPTSATLYGACRPGHGDEAAPDYDPRFVVAVENRETFGDFPSMRGGVCVLGSGRAATRYLPRIAWLPSDGRLVYWGDMDADGLEILASLRRAGLRCSSVLMDIGSFERFAEIGSSTMPNGEEVPMPKGEVPCGLIGGEAELYRAFIADTLPYRRVEQEKIPYDVAVRAIEEAIG